MITVLGQVRAGVGPHVVVGVGLVQVGHQSYGVVEHRHHVREGVPEEAGDPYGDVDPGSAQLRQMAPTSRSTTRRDISSQTGSTPSSASTSAMSSPDVRIADVPQTDSPTELG